MGLHVRQLRNNSQKMSATETRMFRWMSGKTLEDQIKIYTLRTSLKVVHLED